MSLPFYPWIGVIAGIAGSVAINTGNNLQSLGMQQLELKFLEEATLAGKEPPTDIDPKLSKTWRYGTGVFLSGSLLNFASYSLAPQSLLAALESVQFITNVLFGKFMLDKIVTDRMYLGTFLTVSGTVLAIIFSSKQAAPIKGINSLIALWGNPIWISYLAFIITLGAVMQTLYKKYELAALEKNPYPNSENLMAVFYSVYSALFGSTSVVFAKCLAVFVALMTEGEGVSVVESWFFYVDLVAWLVLMGYWLVRLNGALALYDPLFIIPLLQANFIFFAIISGGIYFKEFDYMTASMWVGFISGIVTIFLGIYFLAPVESEGGPLAEETSYEKINRASEVEMADIYSKKPKGGSFENGNGEDTGPRRRRSSFQAVEDDIDQLVHNMYKNVKTVYEDSLTGKTQKMATKFFMSGTAQMNHHSNKMQVIKLKKEQELMRLMGGAGKKAMTPEQVMKVKELMGQIKVVDQSIHLSQKLDHLVKDDGTIAPEDAESFKESILSFKESNKLRDSVTEYGGSLRMSRASTIFDAPQPRRSSIFQMNFFNFNGKKDRSEGDMSDITMGGSTSRRGSAEDVENDLNPRHFRDMQGDKSWNDDDTASSSESMRNNPRSQSRGSTDSDRGLLPNGITGDNIIAPRPGLEPSLSFF